MALTTVPASLSATALTLTTAAQPNITSVGTLTGLTVSGNIAGTLTTAAQTNITSLGTLSALTISGDLTVDTTTLKVDSSNNRVGIGNASPAQSLHVGSSSSGTTSNGIRIQQNEGAFDLRVDGGEFYLYDVDDTRIPFLIDTSGDVGIGTSSPGFGSGSGLEVSRSGTATVRVERTGSTASSGEFFAGNGKVVLSSISNNHLEFRTNNTEVMRIDSTGRVGIGTTSSINSDSLLHLKSTQPNIYFEDTDDSKSWRLEAGSVFKVQNITTSAEAFRITQDGHFGIGTGSPSAGLMVQTSTDGTGLSGDDTNVAYFNNQEATAGRNYGLRVRGGSNATDYALRVDTTNATGALEVDGLGNIGIGTAATLAKFNVLADVANWTGIFKNTNSGAYGFQVDLSQSSAAGGQADIFAHAVYTPAGTGAFILKSGNMGLGTVTPQNKFHVIGNTRLAKTSTNSHALNAATALEVRGDAIGSGVVDVDYFKGFKIALNDGAEWGSQAQFSVGRWAESGNNSLSSLVISLGNGQINSSSNADKDVMTMLSSGAVGIQTTTPAAVLDINGSYNVNWSSDAILRISKNNGNDWSMRLQHGADDYGLLAVGNGSYAISVYNQPASAHRARFNYNGELYLNGGSSAIYNINSDVRLKEEISDAPSQWELVKGLPLQRFKWKDRREGDKWSYGFIAQEVEKTNPEFVEIVPQEKEDQDNGVEDPEYKTVAEGQIHERALAALQEAMKRIEALEAEVRALKGE